jgi:hypothetical protein
VQVLDKYEPLMAAANGKLGGAGEVDAINAAIKTLDVGNSVYYLQQAVKNAQDSARIKDSLAKVQVPVCSPAARL